MASDPVAHPDNSRMTLAELVAFTNKELDADAERQAKVSAAGVGELVRESQTGATLDLSHKNIHLLPIEIITLIKDKVERLALSHNPQIAVPTEIVQCDRLRYLNIRWNQLKDFPEAVLQLSSLEILDISKNRIVGIPEEIKNMTSLKFLAVARNRITRLPLALGEMTSLQKLKFDENPIEFPPPEALKPSQDRVASSIESEREKDVCQQVKRFLKATALREKLRTNSEEDLSESNMATPRPPRRTATGGRFPVKPSISKIEDIDDLRAKSPNGAPPPIPLKSHARISSTSGSESRRPLITPLLTGGDDFNRNRSETAPSSSASVRSRRQGFVPRKTTEPGSAGDARGLGLSLLARSPTIVKPTHSRATSAASTLNSFLAVSSAGETSSDAVSPVDGPHSRLGSVRRLSSLPENRNSRFQASDALRAARRLSSVLFQMHRPTNAVVTALKTGTPKRSSLERQLFNADTAVQELDRLINRLDAHMEDAAHDMREEVRSIIATSLGVLKTYGALVKELKQNVQRLVTMTDAFYARCFMNQVYYTMVEMRNICSLLGFKTWSPAPKSAPRVSRAWSSRTLTPTQAKPVNNRRLRGATILQSMNSHSTLRVMPPPVPLNTSGSRSNTMTSISTSTPRSTESFGSTLLPSNVSSRSNTMRGGIDDSRANTIRSGVDDSDNEDQFEKIFIKLQTMCKIVGESLPHCRTELTARKDRIDGASQPRVMHHWALVINKCGAMITANNSLNNRLKTIKVKDPGVRNQKEFWQLCDTLVHSWTELATEMRDLAKHRQDLTSIKAILRPVQRTMKDISKAISESPIYHQAIRCVASTSAGPSLAPPFPSNLNTSFPPPGGQVYIPPVPATPLSAALGPAIQATVSSTRNALSPAPESFLVAPLTQSGRAAHDRVDTVMQLPIQGRR